MSQEWNADYKESILDSGRMLLVKVSMGPEAAQGEVKLVLDDLAKGPPPKGFRPGLGHRVLRRLYGKRVLARAEANLVAASHEVIMAAVAKKHGFDPKKAPLPTAVKFSEEEGLSYEVIVVGQFLLLDVGAPAQATATGQHMPAPASGSVVDLRSKKESS